MFARLYNHILLFVSFYLIGKTNQSCSLTKFVQGSDYIFSYQCYAPNIENPPLPWRGGSLPSEFNYLQLSPNFYKNISSSDLCQFINILTLDISFNQLTSIVSLFNAFNCYTKIKSLIASNNQISTPLLSKQICPSF
jgi:Leucine-rich repeat (LRR) protein